MDGLRLEYCSDIHNQWKQLGCNYSQVYIYVNCSHSLKEKLNLSLRNSKKTTLEFIKFCAERTAVEQMKSGSGQKIKFGPRKRQSTLNKQLRWAPNCVPPEFIWPEFIIQVYPASTNWAALYDGKKRHAQHLQHFMPRCAHCDPLGQAHEVCVHRNT